MKHKTGKLLALMLTLAMLLTLLPGMSLTAYADEAVAKVVYENGTTKGLYTTLDEAMLDYTVDNGEIVVLLQNNSETGLDTYSSDLHLHLGTYTFSGSFFLAAVEPGEPGECLTVSADEGGVLAGSFHFERGGQLRLSDSKLKIHSLSIDQEDIEEGYHTVVTTAGKIKDGGIESLDDLKEKYGIPNGYTATYDDEDGYWTVTEAPKVAKIGETQYTTLAEAFAAAQDDDTIVLLGDVELTEETTTSKNVTLDLGGNTLDMGQANLKIYSILTVIANPGGTLTGVGSVGSTEEDGQLRLSDPDLVVDGVNTHFDWHSPNAVVYTACKFKNLEGSTEEEIRMLFDIPDGYTVTYDEEDGYWVVAEAPKVAKIGDTQYTSLKDAFSDMDDNVTIVLLDDVVLNEYTVDPGYENVKLDLNGHSLDANGNLSVTDLTVIATNGGTLIGHISVFDENQKIVFSDPNLILNGVSFETGEGGTITTIAAKIKDDGIESFDALKEKYGIPDGYTAKYTYNPNDGEYWVVTAEEAPVAQIGETQYTSLQDAFDAASQTGDTIVLLSDVVLTERTSISWPVTLDLGGHTLNMGANFSIDSPLTVIANPGGTLTGIGSIKYGGGLRLYDPDLILDGVSFDTDDGGTVTTIAAKIKDGSITTEDGLRGTYGVFATSTVTKDDENGYWVVAEAPKVAQIGETQYTTLQAAFAAAGNNYTIVLLSNVELTDGITTSKNVTLNLDGHTLKNEGDNEYIIFVQKALTITAGGKNTSALSVDLSVQDGGHVTLSDAALTVTKNLRNNDTAEMTITAGRFNFDPSEYVPSGYTATYDDEDGYWVVAEAPASPYAGLVNTTTVVKFNDHDWYIIADNSTAADASTVTLLAKECVASSKYNESGSFVEYSSNPTVKTEVDNWYSTNITADAKAAVSGGAMFLLTKEQASAITNADVMKCSNASNGGWWLCSQGSKYDYYAAYVNGYDGGVDVFGYYVERVEFGVRPALTLDLSKVTFDSASNTFAVPAAPIVEYPLWVGGVQVTSANASDVLGDADEGATVSFTPAVEDDPETTEVNEAAPATLTLSGANITTGHEYSSGDSFAGICYEGTSPLTIELASGTNNTIDIDGSQKWSNGIGFYTENYSNSVDLILTGEGSLTTKATGKGSCGINVTGSITVNSGVVTAESVGQYATGMGAKNVTINGGVVTAAGVGEGATGIIALDDVMIEDGEVTVTGSANAIYIYGSVKNAIAGTGWTDVDGTEGATAIAVSSEGQNLNSYKKLQFPPPPCVSITAGAGMTKTTDSGAASQTDLTGAMTDVVYTANAGYYFPTNYSVDPVNGISVTRNSSAQITVSGTPTADVTVTLPDAVSIPSPVVINSSNFSDYFDENGVLRYIVPAESVLDFQGEFKGEQYTTITINKKVTVTSTSEPAAKFNGTDTENNVNMTFNTVAGADYTTISNLEFLNCRLAIQGVTNVTVDNINLSVKDKRVGAGIGTLTIWGGANDATVSDIVVKNSHFECRNNGGATFVAVGRGANHITFENNTAAGSGNIGNMFYVTPYNFLGATDPGYVTFKNNNIESDDGGGISNGITLVGEGHVLEGNTIKWKVTAIAQGFGATAANCTFKDNTITNGGGITIYSFSTAEGNVTDGNVTVNEGAVFTGNTVGGTLTVGGKDTQIKQNTVNKNVTINGSNTIFENNGVTGTVTVGRNSKGNSLTGNTVVSTEDYAVILQSTATDSNTSVENNSLISRDKLGDDAVNPGRGSGNTIQNNNGNGYTALQDEWIQPIADMTYTGSALEPEVVVMNGSTALTLGTDYQVAYKDNLNAGTATVTVTRVEGSSYAGKAEKTFTVKKAPAPTTITPSEEQKPTAITGNDMVYSGSALALVTAPTSYPDPYTGMQYSTDGGTTWSDQVPTGTTAGDYTVKVKYTSANYEDLAGEDVAVTIAKAAAPDASTITEAQKPTAKTGDDAVYTGNALALVTAPSSLPTGYTGVQYSRDDGTTWSDQIPTGTDAGGYTVKVKYTSNNYDDLAGDDVSVTITKAAAPDASTITEAQKPTAKTGSDAVYSGNALALVTAPSSLPTGYTGVQYSTDNGTTWSDQIPTGTDAGGYTVKVKYTSNNYDDLAGEDLAVTIAKVAPTVTAPTAKTLTYIGSAQELVKAGSTKDGTLYYAVTTGNTAPTNENLYTASIPTGIDSGTYYVWYKVVGDNNHSDTEPAPITVMIGERSLTITAAGASKTFDGTALTKNSYFTTGLAEGDRITSIKVTGSITSAGSAPNTASDAVITDSEGRDVTGKYDITYRKGTLVVVKKPVLVKADDKTKVYDNDPATDPELTATVTGEVKGYPVNYTLSREAGEAVGSYKITVTPGNNPNYVLSVTGAELTITEGTAPVYGEPDFTLPGAIRTIEANAFEGGAMSIVYIPDPCTAIGAGAFKDCANLTQIRLPKNCALDDTIFTGCGKAYVFAPAGGTTESWCRGKDNIVFVSMDN